MCKTKQPKSKMLTLELVHIKSKEEVMKKTVEIVDLEDTYDLKLRKINKKTCDFLRVNVDWRVKEIN